MSYLKYFFYLLFIPSALANFTDPFQVILVTPNEALEYAQNRVELQMSRDTRYCRGAMMPRSSLNGWRCQNHENNQKRCVLTYQCARVNQRFSRLSESRRLIEAGKRLQKSQLKYSVSFEPTAPIYNL